MIRRRRGTSTAACAALRESKPLQLGLNTCRSRSRNYGSTLRRACVLFIKSVESRRALATSIRKIRALYARGGLRLVKDRIVLRLAQFDANDYDGWIERYDTLTNQDRARMRARIESFAHKPLISVIMPTYNSESKWLIAAIESVIKQIYPYWELCIADDASTKATVRPILERYARTDPRIKVIFRERNGNIAAASNSALELASGQWVALLDHDDLLSEHALFWVADAINQNPDVRLIYSDRDKIDERGRRTTPYFKCDWNADLFHSHNLIAHLDVYRKDLLDDVGRFREGFEGAQDYDLALRCIERIEPGQIHHIARLLYHWRMHRDSTADSTDTKPHAMAAGERALNEHFQRLKIGARAERIEYGYRARYALPRDQPSVTIIIPTRNGSHFIENCVASILTKTTYPNYEILIVDNGSNDSRTLRYLDAVQATGRVKVRRDERPFNYSALNNVAAEAAQSEFLALLNDDVEVISPDWLSEMISIASQPGVGAVGARLWYPSDTLQHGGVILGIGGVAGHSHKHLPRYLPGYLGRATLTQEFLGSDRGVHGDPQGHLSESWRPG